MFGLSAIGQIAIEVKNLDVAISFYKDKLGIPFLFSAPPGLAFLDCNGLRLMLTTPEKPAETLINSTLYFKVAKIHDAVSALKERGVPFEAEPHLIAHMEDYDLWMAFFRDPDRNLLGLMCEIPLEK